MLVALNGRGKGKVHPMRAPSVIKLRTHGGRYRKYYPVSSLDPIPFMCAFCELEMPSLENTRAHIEVCPKHPARTAIDALNRLAARLGCEPRQVADRVIRMLEEWQK